MDGKLEKLTTCLGQWKRVLIAFSGGVDSTFLASVAGEVLGTGVLLVTAQSSTYPVYERDEARNLAALLGLAHREIVSEEIDIPGFSENPPDRCYHCKRELFSRLLDIARTEEYDAVCDGTNADDVDDYRPGARALQELGIRSPLRDCALTKDDIRRFSRERHLPTADKPAYACLASRFPYGEAITTPKLDRVGRAEELLRKKGFARFRVRSHGDCARCEFAPDDLERAWRIREEITAVCREAGFVFVALDTTGYRSGAMNEALKT